MYRVLREKTTMEGRTTEGLANDGVWYRSEDAAVFNTIVDALRFLKSKKLNNDGNLVYIEGPEGEKHAIQNSN